LTIIKAKEKIEKVLSFKKEVKAGIPLMAVVWDPSNVIITDLQVQRNEVNQRTKTERTPSLLDMGLMKT
jgi:hypothetical protein